jgi:hypothetical protein
MTVEERAEVIAGLEQALRTAEGCGNEKYIAALTKRLEQLRGGRADGEGDTKQEQAGSNRDPVVAAPGDPAGTHSEDSR